MNTIIHDMEGTIEIGDTFTNPKFRSDNRLQTFDRVVSNPMWNQDWFKLDDYDADEWGRFPQGAGFPGARPADWGWAQHILASLNSGGRAVIVLHPGAASRGSGTANKNKEKSVRQWFVEQDLIEGVVYLPENLFYNTPSPGILLLLNKNKPLDRRGKLFLVNASEVLEKGDPKNFIPNSGIERIAAVFNGWQEKSAFAKIVTREQVGREDYNISPGHYIQIGEVSRHRPIQDLVEDLDQVRADSIETMAKAVKAIEALKSEKAAWQRVRFADCLIHHSAGRGNQINTSEIKPNGRIPVIDQGQAFIAGYTDDESKVIRDGLPYVIFGDHTRCFKYVDFPFVLGADGTKILKPDPAQFHPKFFYFAVKALKIANRGYNRHYTLLKEQLVPRPEYTEQVSIAAILSELEAAESQQLAMVQILKELSAATLEELVSGRMRIDSGLRIKGRSAHGTDG